MLNSLNGGFFGQPWTKWAAFVVLLLAITYLWSRLIK